MDGMVGRRRSPWLAAVAVAVLFFLVLPVLIVLPMSFSDSRFLDFPPRSLSLRWYAAYVRAPEWMDATRVSLIVAVVTCALTTPLGVAAAYGIHVSEWPLVRRLRTVLLLPLMVPHIIIAIGIFFIFAPLKLVGTLPGLVLAHSMLALPFVVVTTLAGLRSFDMDQERAARSLGFSRLQAFLRVTLPQIRPSVLSGALFAFITSLDEVIVSLFVSGHPNTTLTKIMFTALRDEIDPTIAAISSLLIVCSLSIALAAVIVGGRRAA